MKGEKIKKFIIKEDMNKIAIICPYFGKFPSNIELTFESMKKNNFIDWYIFTDIIGYNEKYNNIKFVYYEFNDVKKLVKEKIGTDITNVYKLCDYKPTYGFLFESYMMNYEYWGYCDLDIIFGDLSKYFNTDRLNNFSKVYDLGHLSIFKNTKEIRESFKNFKFKEKNYVDILNSKYIFVFDETYDKNHKGINGVLEGMGYKIYNERKEYADLDVKYNNFYPNYYDKCKYYYLLYKDGKLYLKKSYDNAYEKEVAYVHLQQKKNLKVECDLKDNFIIVPKGFYNIQNINKNMFYKNDLKIFWYLKFRFKRKLNNYKRNKELGERW